VLTLLAGGLNNTELADALQLSEATVKTHITRILSNSSSAIGCRRWSSPTRPA